MPASKIARTAEELEEIAAEGHDWYAEGYDCAEEYLTNWKAGKLALGYPIEKQPAGPLANRMWREGFNDRIEDHQRSILSRSGLESGRLEVERWKAKIKSALEIGAAQAGGAAAAAVH